ncbi:hypothetical protein LTR09_007476 [Extremus antarcticus]|uniref:Uncharacterized protein n=1 Tax=Extremus antarcticus TaxID=702011 RepID=A0AAJ0DCP6_9PEZI|nr:hypothetical protein LTR09_007476 [Extremus antarcticus]
MASHSDTELDVMSKKGEAQISIGAVDEEAASDRTWRRKAAAVIWDSLDKSPEERKFIAKIDWWILSYCCVAYFVKYLELIDMV